MLTDHRIIQFQEEIYAHYRDHGRNLPWRNVRDPYKILISEVMLQQTQSERVIPKYTAFIECFPNVTTLAQAQFTDVYTLWQGLGYNRRARSLVECAKRLVELDHGKVPRSIEKLARLPGIGPYTAAAICAFAYNQPVVVLETNIRRVYLHSFFREADNVPDTDLVPLIKATLDHEHPRQWYYALMDYGAALGKLIPNPNRRSAHYAQQSRFIGSLRQARGAILKLLVEHPGLGLGEIVTAADLEAAMIEKALSELVKEKLIRYTDGYRLC